MTEFERIDTEDYFRMNDTFCVWLIKKKKVRNNMNYRGSFRRSNYQGGREEI